MMGDISENFSRAEFACSDHCGFDTVDATLIKYLETIREHFDSPVRINSGCRCPAKNKKVHGSEKSQHLYGRAADIAVDGIEPELVHELAEQMEVGGLGEYLTFTHVDSRTGHARW